MPSFLVRVELHLGSGADYVKLHEAMERAGFTRLVLGTSKVQYQLPTAEYDLVGDYTIAAVHDMAKRAADSTGKENAILVTQYVSMTWSGLAVAS